MRGLLICLQCLLSCKGRRRRARRAPARDRVMMDIFAAPPPAATHWCGGLQLCVQLRDSWRGGRREKLNLCMGLAAGPAEHDARSSYFRTPARRQHLLAPAPPPRRNGHVHGSLRHPHRPPQRRVHARGVRQAQPRRELQVKPSFSRVPDGRAARAPCTAFGVAPQERLISSEDEARSSAARIQRHAAAARHPSGRTTASVRRSGAAWRRAEHSLAGQTHTPKGTGAAEQRRAEGLRLQGLIMVLFQ